MKISVHIPGHGRYEASPELVDRAIADYLPNSAAGLRALIAEQAGDPLPVGNVSDALIVLASFYGDNPY